jgi:hypothetical protein
MKWIRPAGYGTSAKPSRTSSRLATAQIFAVFGRLASRSATRRPLTVRSLSVGGVIPSKVSKR